MKTKADLSQSIAEVQTALREIATLADDAALKAEEVNDVILGKASRSPGLQEASDILTALREIATLARNAGLKAEEVNDVILG